MFRLYSEHVPLAELDAPLLRDLAARRIELAVAAFPGRLEEYTSLCRRAGACGVSVVVWPLLDDADGRWPSPSNAHAFGRHALGLAEALTPRTMLFDLEPPIAWTRLALALRYAPRPRSVDPAGELSAVARAVSARGFRVEAVVPPMLAFGPGWERWLGTPASALGCERVEPMAYTSLFEGYSRGLVPRRVALDLLRRITLRGGDAVSLGVVGGGALGDERAYRDVQELRDDVAAAYAAGARRLSLYSLDGILARGDADAWLDAFTELPTARIAPSPPVRATRRGALLDLAGSLLG